MNQDRIEDLISTIKNHLKEGIVDYPDQAIFALEDKKFASIVDSRFENGNILIDIRSLGFDTATGLNRIYFLFAPPKSLIFSHDSVLVLLDYNCNVVGILDPFDHINPDKTPSTSTSTSLSKTNSPFVIYQPSNSTTKQYTFDDISVIDESAKKYISEISDRGPVSLPEGLLVSNISSRPAIGLSDGQGGVFTGCATKTHWPTRTCRQVTGVFGSDCVGTDHVTTIDQTSDDCAPSLVLF